MSLQLERPKSRTTINTRQTEPRGPIPTPFHPTVELSNSAPPPYTPRQSTSRAIEVPDSQRLTQTSLHATTDSLRNLSVREHPRPATLGHGSTMEDDLNRARQVRARLAKERQKQACAPSEHDHRQFKHEAVTLKWCDTLLTHINGVSSKWWVSAKLIEALRSTEQHLRSASCAAFSYRLARLPECLDNLSVMSARVCTEIAHAFDAATKFEGPSDERRLKIEAMTNVTLAHNLRDLLCSLTEATQRLYQQMDHVRTLHAKLLSEKGKSRMSQVWRGNGADESVEYRRLREMPIDIEYCLHTLDCLGHKQTESFLEYILYYGDSRTRFNRLAFLILSHACWPTSASYDQLSQYIDVMDQSIYIVKGKKIVGSNEKQHIDFLTHAWQKGSERWIKDTGTRMNLSYTLAFTHLPSNASPSMIHALIARQMILPMRVEDLEIRGTSSPRITYGLPKAAAYIATEEHNCLKDRLSMVPTTQACYARHVLEIWRYFLPMDE